MKVIFNRGDIHNLNRMQEILVKHIVEVDPSAADELKDAKDAMTQLRELATLCPKLVTVTEVEDEVIIEYAETYLGDVVHFVETVAPVVIPLVHAIDKVIELFGDVRRSIMDAIDTLAEKYI